MQHKSWHRSLGFLRVAASSNFVVSSTDRRPLHLKLETPFLCVNLKMVAVPIFR